MTEKQSKSVRLDWKVELFPFLNADPLDETLFSLGITSDVDVITTAGIDESSKKGIGGISLSRSKGVPDGVCEISFIGEVPDSVVLGTWVIVSTTSNQDIANTIPRFIGQIYTIEPAYMTSPNGLTPLRTEVKVREWSSALTSAIQFNLTSVLAQNAKSQSFAGVGAGLNLAGGNYDDKRVKEVTSAALNPYHMAQLVLSLVGCISSVDLAKDIKKLSTQEYPEIMTTMPSMPRAILDRLGMPATLSTTNPFGNKDGEGIVTVISGIQTEAFRNDGTWDGFLSDGDFDKFKKMYDNVAEDKPRSTAIGMLTQLNFSAWSILSSMCEPSVNEAFTDIMYVRKDGKIIPKLVVFIRDKPFLTNHAQQLAKKVSPKIGITTKWSRYENLPRAKIDSVYIAGMRFSGTLLNSPNMVQPTLTSSIVDDKLSGALSAQNGFVRIDSTMRRWGGDPSYPTATYTFTSASDKNRIEDFISEMKALFVAWHSFNYKMLSGTLLIKDPGYPIMVGMNVQFNFGEKEFVGHVDSVNMQMVVDEKGLPTTHMSIQLQRIMAVDGSNLRLLEPIEISDIRKKPQHPALNLTQISLPNLSLPPLKFGEFKP
jgi:hypothetical protein